MKKKLCKKILAFALIAGMVAGSYSTAMATGAETEPETIPILTGEMVVSEDGTYQLAADATGVITIEEDVEQVTLIGTEPVSEDVETIYKNILIDCSKAEGIALTLKDISIDNTEAVTNVIAFAGEDNTLIFDGNVELKQGESDFSCVYVPQTAELTMYGTTGSIAYISNGGASVCIGGNTAEASGAVTVGQADGQDDFVIHIQANGAGDLIGGTTYMKGGSLNLHVEGSGAAISAAAEKFVYEAGSVYTQSTLGDGAILANKVNSLGEKVYIAAVTPAEEADVYVVKVDGDVYYNGPAFTDENNPKAEFYIYLTGETHRVEVNDTMCYYVFNEETGAFSQEKFIVGVTGKGQISVSEETPAAGTKMEVTVVPETGYYLAQLRYEYYDGTELVYEVAEVEETGGTYQLDIKSDTGKITADFISIVWDGTIDITWYDPEETTYKIYYPAQLAGVAAIDNGLFNDFPQTTDETGNKVPHVDENSIPYGSDMSGYNLYKSATDGALTGKTAVVGNIEYLKALCGEGGTGDNNLLSTNTFWYGPDDFTGKTVLIMNDLNMGGSYTGDKTKVDNWSGPRYMPIGGQYCMDVTNGLTHLGSSFNGTLNGQGYAIYNVYCNRFAAGGNYGDTASVGIVGRLGVHDNEPVEMRTDVAVRNLAVDGIFYGRRHTGGIVGKIGQNNSAIIENCINFATIKGTDAKGASGICGAAWNKSKVFNCVNFGYVSTAYDKNAGGIAGSNEAYTKNCYNFGYVGTTNANKDAAQALGTNNGGALWTNCYYLTGSSASVKYPAVYNAGVLDTVYEVKDAATLKTADFLADINGNGRGWLSSAEDAFVSKYIPQAMHGVSSYTSELLPYDVMGMPVPRAFVYDMSAFKEIGYTGTPVISYGEGQVFDAGDLQVWAYYSDGTKEEIEDYTVTYQTEGKDCFTAGETKVTISGEYRGKTYSYTFDVTVVIDHVKSISVSYSAANRIYATGETFDPTGLVVTATYDTGIKRVVTDYAYAPEEALTSSDKSVVISYTYRDETVKKSIPITVYETEAPEIIDKVVQITCANDLCWFSNQVSMGQQYDAILLADIDLTESSWVPVGRKSTNNPTEYRGTFDGNGKTVTFDYSATSRYVGLFGCIGEGAIIKDVTIAGNIACGSDAGAIAGWMNGGTIINCVNKANITSASTSDKEAVGGIAGHVAGTAVIKNCTNLGDITISEDVAYTQIGGIAGYTEGNDWSITMCKNNGNITTYGDAGGIVGYAYGDGLIQYCSNDGKIQTTSGRAQYAAGGILGNATQAVTIDRCVNRGAITGNTLLGGIAGILTVSECAVTNCYNAGTVQCTASGSAFYAGGIVGKTSAAEVMIENCYTDSEASTDSAETTAVDLVGYSAGSTKFKNNYVFPKDWSAEVATALGDAYVSVEDGYPVLSWEMRTYVKILTQPTDFTGEIGNVAALAVEASGEGLTYQWQYSEDGITWQDSAEEGATSAKLYVPLTTVGSKVQYRCVVKDIFDMEVTSSVAFVECEESQVAHIHTPAKVDGRPATCTEPGLTAGYYCQECKEVLQVQEEIKATGHSWDEGVIEAEATLYGKGTLRYTCVTCLETYTEDVEYRGDMVVRVSGKNRYLTALKTADELKVALGVEKFDAVVLATGDNYADALSGSYLAIVKKAPILLINDNKAAEVQQYIKENLKEGGTVYVLGGTGAVSEKAVKGLENVVRLSGKSRFETNIEVLKEAGIEEDTELLVSTGLNFADSLSASASGKPILLVNNNKDALEASQKEFLESAVTGKIYVIGGEGAVNSSLEKELKGYGSVDRISGKNRYDTSILVAKQFFENPDAAVLAYSHNFPDGLSGGPLAAAMNAPLLLTQTGAETAAKNYVQETTIERGVVLGGTSLISDEAVDIIYGTTK